MITGDYIKREKKTCPGKFDKIVTSTTGVEYAIGKAFGSGGVGTVFRARRLRDKKDCVFKEYVPIDMATRRVHRAIKKNIQRLMEKPLTKENGDILYSFVGPMDKDSLIELPASKGFGYVMELVDTKAYLTVPKLLHDRYSYPDAKILCRACRNIAYLFKRVHAGGWCYKDINEQNIYINNKTGSVRIIDCDNISGDEHSRTIQGTPGPYMAPEVYTTGIPDTYTDYFSMAVLFYRIFVGGYPMDGKKANDYMMRNNMNVFEAAPTIYGDIALFVFDPKDKSNEIRNLKDKDQPLLYKAQTQRWERLPEKLKNGFIKTFSEGLKIKDRHMRATDSYWINTFEDLRNTGLVECRKCKKMNFGDPTRHIKCLFCGENLPKIKQAPEPKPAGNKSTFIPKPKPTPAADELTTVKFEVLSDIDGKTSKIVSRKQVISGKAFHPDLGLNDGWIRIEYNKKAHELSAVNSSRFTWSIKGAKKDICLPGKRVILTNGLVITVSRRKLQLRVIQIK